MESGLKLQNYTLCVIITTALLLAGCGKDRIAEAERHERGTSLYRQAITAEQSGNIKEAIKLFNKVLIEEPRSFSAHFQLATLLHDHEEDYLSAIFHYKQYLMLRPDSDKSTLASERIRVAEQMLAPQILKRVGESVQGISQAHLLKENDRLNRAITTLEGEKVTLLDAQAQAEKEIERLKGDNERLRDFLRKMRVEESAAPSDGESAREAGIAARDDGKTTGTTRTNIRDVKALREEASALAREGTGSGARKPVIEIPSPDSMMKRVEQKMGEVPQPPETEVATKPPPPDNATGRELSVMSLFGRDKKEKSATASANQRTYVVQPGDTLFRVAEKFYGDSTKWKRIRDANRGNIDPDGRIRAGQIITIP